MLNEKYIQDQNDLPQGKVFIEFYAPFCSFCRASEPTVEKLSNEFSDVEFFKVNTDECPQAAESFGVRGLPTFVALNGGKEQGRIRGAKPEAELRRLVESL